MEKRRELGRKYGFGAAQEPVSAARIDEAGPGDSSGRPEVEELEISNPLFAPTVVATVPGWCGQL